MKNLYDPRIDCFRQKHPRAPDAGDQYVGLFIIPHHPTKGLLRAIVSSGLLPGSEGWDHVSVSLTNRCPNWPEMCFIKDLFFEPSDWCVQFHPAESDYVNHHPHCLHIWRHVSLPMPTPPSWMVGPKAGQSREEACALADAAMQKALSTT